MLAEIQTFEKLLSQANKLSPEYRIKLIQRITASLLPYPKQKFVSLQFGKYSHNQMSSIEDFAVVEWRPTGDEYSST